MNRWQFVLLKRFAFLFLFFFCFLLKLTAQFSIRDSSLSFPMIGATFAYQLPGGDMADRFGNNFNIGAIFQWKLRCNWIIGIEGDFLFSDHVKENNILDKYFTPDGNIIDGSGHYSLPVTAAIVASSALRTSSASPFDIAQNCCNPVRF